MNRLRDRTLRDESVHDEDIIRIRFIPFDFDWYRPAGISATDEEHIAALGRTMEFVAALKNEQIRPTLVGDSGNGGHVLLAVDLPNDQNTNRLIKRLFEAVAAKFSDAPTGGGFVKFDTANSNASRPWKVYGTIAAKGDHTDQRPHRTAAIEVLETIHGE
jgi:hypothetical protein